jgi:hypothetical protein
LLFLRGFGARKDLEVLTHDLAGGIGEQGQGGSVVAAIAQNIAPGFRRHNSGGQADVAGGAILEVELLAELVAIGDGVGGDVGSSEIGSGEIGSGGSGQGGRCQTREQATADGAPGQSQGQQGHPASRSKRPSPAPVSIAFSKFASSKHRGHY